jgi:hypothetical protein
VATILKRRGKTVGDDSIKATIVMAWRLCRDSSARDKGLFTLVISRWSGKAVLPSRSGYCATAQNQRKTAQTQGKTVDYPLVSPSVGYRKIFTGGTATGQ